MMGNYQKLILTYLDQVWRRRWIALAVAWTVCVLGWTVVSLLPDKYDSEARVFVDTQSLLNPLLKGLSVRSEDQRRDQDVQIMQRTLTSRPNLAKVAQLTDLDKSANSAGELQTLLDNLQNRIEVTNQGNNLFRVRFTDNSPSMAKRVVQALLTIFVESNVGDRRADMQTARSFIENQLSEYEKKLSEAEKKLADFKIANVDYISSAENFSTRLEQARVVVKERKRELNDLSSQRDQLKQQIAATPQFLSIDAAPQVVIGPGGGTSIEQRIRTLQTKIGELRLQYTDKHPEILRSLEALKELQDEQVKNASGGETNNPVTKNAADRAQVTNDVYTQLSLRLTEAETKVSSAKRRVDDAEDELNELVKKSAEGPRVEAEFTALTRGYQVLKGNYESLLSRRESARIGEAADSSADSVQFRIIAEPEEPAFPTGPKRRIFNIAILIMGIGAGAGAVILLAKLQDCVTGPEDLVSFGHHMLLGTVSMSEGLTLPEPFYKRHARFTAGLAALGGVGALMIAISPNLSTIPAAVALRLASL